MQNLKTNNLRIILGFIILIIGFYLLISFSWAWWGLFASSILAWKVTFGPDSKIIIKKPEKIWIIPLGVICYFIISMLMGLIAMAFGFKWVGSPATGHLFSLAVKIPFMLMGEELLGIGVLEACKSKGLSIRISSLISALIFGLLHLSVYWDGSLFSSVLHVLLLQGIARLIFNHVYERMGRSIWGSWITHCIVDFLALGLGR